MNTRIGTALLSITLGAPWLPAAADAQTFDHLKCYKVKDGQKFKQAVVDLTPLATPPFPLEPGCVVKGKAKKVCTPVDKSVVETDANQLAISGAELTSDFLCYKIKCPTLDGPDLLTADQFGGRLLSKLKAKELCVPTGGAGTVTTTTLPQTTTTLSLACGVAAGPPTCDGSCPNSGSCVYDSQVSGNCVCTLSECDQLVDLGGFSACVGNCGVSGGACGCDAGVCLCSTAVFPCGTNADCGIGDVVCANGVCGIPGCSVDGDCGSCPGGTATCVCNLGSCGCQ